MMKFSEMIKSSPFYRSMMDQIPESERPAAEAQILSMLESYNTIVSAAPGEVMTQISSVMSSDDSSSTINNVREAGPTKRAPRRF